MALPQHIAESLWLSGAVSLIRLEAAPPAYGDGSLKINLGPAGKPKAYRYVLRRSRSYLLRKAPAIFTRHQERLNHLGALEIAVELVQLGQPEVIAGVVRVRSIVGVPS